MTDISQPLQNIADALIAKDAEIERLRALVQQHDDEVWVGLERAKDVRNATIEECAKVIEQWENDDTPRSYLDLIAAIRALKDKP